MPNDWERWLKQARADLKAARDSAAAGNYEWSCFQAQQAAEKALNACLRRRGYVSVITHSLVELVAACEKLDRSFSMLHAAGKFLDGFYIPTRYPSGLVGNLTPAEFFEKEDAERCSSSSESILSAAESFLKQ